MSPRMSRIARLLVVAGAALAFAAAPIAAADPEDLVPLCSGDQTPAEDNCRNPCPEGAPLTFDGTCGEPGTVDVSGGPADELTTDVPGADPEVPVGTNPDEVG